MSDDDETEFMRLVWLNTERVIKEDAHAFPVRLRRGPMDRYLVHDHADAMNEDFYDKATDNTKAKHRSGRYVLLDEMEKDARVAQWREDP